MLFPAGRFEVNLMILLPHDLPGMTRVQARHPSWVEPAASLSEVRDIPRQGDMRNNETDQSSYIDRE